MEKATRKTVIELPAILTIDRVRTRVKIKDCYGSIPEYSRQRPQLVASTLFRILNPSKASMLPHNPSPRSRYQEMLRQLKADGLLVESRTPR
jgi:hypothetical protein